MKKWNKFLGGACGCFMAGLVNSNILITKTSQVNEHMVWSFFTASMVLFVMAIAEFEW